MNAAAPSASDRAPEPPDIRLVEASRAGDGQAYRALYERHVSEVYSFLRWTAGSEEEAEEITQEVFVRAWQKLDQYEGRSLLSTWLIRIAINAFRERRRSLLRWSRRRIENLDPAHLPSESDDRREQLMDLERAIQRLPRRARMVLVLAQRGYAHAEIAGMMGTTVGACKAQLNRAKRLLRGEVER